MDTIKSCQKDIMRSNVGASLVELGKVGRRNRLGKHVGYRPANACDVFTVMDDQSFVPNLFSPVSQQGYMITAPDAVKH